jgi:hypothetical protein
MTDHIIFVLSRRWLPIAVLFGTYVTCIAGLIGIDLGVPSLFRDPEDLAKLIDNVNFWDTRNSPVFSVFLFLPLLAGLVWTFSATSARRKDPHPSGSIVSPSNLVAGTFFLWALALTCFVVRVLIPAVADTSTFAVIGASAREIGRALLASTLGLIVTTAWAWLLARWLLCAIRDRYAEWCLIGILPAFVFFGILTHSKLVPAISLLALFGIATLVYFLFAFSHRVVRLPLFLAIAVTAVVASLWDGQYRFRIPGIADDSGKQVYLATPLPSLDDSKPVTTPNSGVRPVEALGEWLSSRPKDRPAAKLVIITTSGGAYRAAFWTALVLDKLREKTPDLLDDVRLLTGASGGMVGSAYFAVLRARTRSCPVEKALLHDSYVGQFVDADGRISIAESRLPKCALDADHCACGTNDFRTRLESAAIAGDTLSPVAQRFIQHDLWRLWIPGEAGNDRGRVLERQWRTLDRVDDQINASEDSHVFDFAELAKATRSAKAPSIIFSPTLLDTGVPLLISDLTLESFKDLALGPLGAEVGVEFFEHFPAARKGFSVSTATRLNATFPYVSPTPALPTTGADRVGDAGYFDNYGGVAAAAYLGQPNVRDWVVTNTAGVIVIRINAFDETNDPQKISPTQTFVRRINVAVAAVLGNFTGPLEGALSARGASMFRRNDLEFGMVKSVYQQSAEKAGKPDFSFHVFDLAAKLPPNEKVSLSWYITPTEINSLREALDEKRFADTFSTIERCWRSGSRSFRDPDCR